MVSGSWTTVKRREMRVLTQIEGLPPLRLGERVIRVVVKSSRIDFASHLKRRIMAATRRSDYLGLDSDSWGPANRFRLIFSTNVRVWSPFGLGVGAGKYDEGSIQRRHGRISTSDGRVRPLLDRSIGSDSESLWTDLPRGTISTATDGVSVDPRKGRGREPSGTSLRGSRPSIGRKWFCAKATVRQRLDPIQGYSRIWTNHSRSFVSPPSEGMEPVNYGRGEENLIDQLDSV